MPSELSRVFFDSNAGTHVSGYVLRFEQSKTDLNAISGGPRSGLLVTIYMPDEFETEAYLYFDAQEAVWIAKPASIDIPVRYIGESMRLFGENRAS